MTRRLRPGLYEELLTSALQPEVEQRRADGWLVHRDSIDAAVRPEFLARHVYDVLRRVLESLAHGRDDPSADQVALVNGMVEALVEFGALDEDQLADVAEPLLLEVAQSPAVGGSPSLTPRPTLSLRRTGLLVNGRRDVQIASEIGREIPSADRIDLLCAFVRHSGLRLFRTELRERLRQPGVSLRVIAGVYTGSTERRALDALVDLGAKVKVSYEVARTRLHAKAWLFHRNSGLHTAYIGSSNLTHSAQVEGLEWNVRLSAAENPDVIDRFRATFEQYWQEPEFQDYAPDRDGERLDRALAQQRGGAKAQDLLDTPLLVDVAPKPHQEVVLEALDAERGHGHYRNLVVAATGTGKTWIAAFDFKRLQAGGARSLLFVAHRDEILRQSQQVFQLVLRDAAFGERLVGGERPATGHHVFASIQSLANHIDGIRADAFDVVIVDEFHHAAARSYERLLSHLEPKVLLGLTATPERADGKSVLDWFGGRIASESRLWDALDQGLLCPFHYFGINDGTDLSEVRFERGAYVPGELDNLFTGDSVRAARIVQAVHEFVTQPNGIRALGFCAGVEHARFMAREFTRRGLDAVALDAGTPRDERRNALARLRRGDLRVVFAVDLFNEGVDLPEVDTVLMLRPTESATVFLQQLGRGLRWADGKHVLTVLDFVGQAHREYRYDVRYQALLGGTRHQVRRAVEEDFPLLPPGCALKLDRLAKDKVLRNIRDAVGGARARLADDLRRLGTHTRLGRFLRDAGVDLEEIYAKPASGHSFTELRRLAGFGSRDVAGVDDGLLNAVGRLLHVNDDERIGAWLNLLKSNRATPVSRLGGRAHRLALMLFAPFAGRRRSVSEADDVIEGIRSFPDLREEVIDLLEELGDRARTLPEAIDPAGEVPLASHASYGLGEIAAAYGHTNSKGALHYPQTGVLWDAPTRTDLLFVTLEKSDKDYSPSTRYADYPISPTLFHWESQNTASPHTRTGRRYIEQPSGETRVVLFVRERKRDDRRQAPPYQCLGYAHYLGHESERPMKIRWRLERPMPGSLYQAGKVVAG